MKRTVGILSGILAFFALVLGVGIILIVIGWPVSEAQLAALAAQTHRMPGVLILLLVALACIAIGVVVLYGMIGRHLNRRTTALLEKNALGETAVSFSALQEIAERTVKSRGDVRSCKTKVHAIGSSVRIDVRVVTSPTVSLLELTHALQDMIRDAILSLCGTEVAIIDVTVDQADTPQKKA